MTCWLQRNRKR